MNSTMTDQIFDRMLALAKAKARSKREARKPRRSQPEKWAADFERMRARMQGGGR